MESECKMKGFALRCPHSFRSSITARILLIFSLAGLFSCANSPITKTPEKNKPALIVIDPGHGGSNIGAIVNYQKGNEIITIMEKELTLKIARLVAAGLHAKLPQAQIVLTRTDDADLSLEERVFILNQLNNDAFNAVFVSIHVNFSPNKDSSGFEVYYHIPALLDPDAVVSAQYLKETMRQNTPLAESIVNAVGSVKGLENLPRSMKSGDYYVIRNAGAISALIECGFLSNEKEAFLLIDGSYQKKIAEAVASGIENYLKIKK